MHQIDLDNWPRRDQYEHFRRFDHPHFNLCAHVDVTELRKHLKAQGTSFTVGLVYLLARTANAIPEFRYRLRDNGVIEHDVVHPSYTLLVDQELFSFCFVTYQPDYSAFAATATERIAYLQSHPTLSDPGDDNLLFMTALPWVSFTSFSHPMNYNPGDSVPRFAWGKIFIQGNRQLMPLSVQGHHAVMDGLHIGRYFAELQEYLDDPSSVLDPI